MPARYEGCDAQWTSIGVEGPGSEIGEDVVPAGNVAVVFSYDEVFVYTGEPDLVIAQLRKAIRHIEIMKEEGRV